MPPLEKSEPVSLVPPFGFLLQTPPGRSSGQKTLAPPPLRNQPGMAPPKNFFPPCAERVFSKLIASVPPAPTGRKSNRGKAQTGFVARAPPIFFPLPKETFAFFKPSRAVVVGWFLWEKERPP